jgi:hypothetical protein
MKLSRHPSPCFPILPSILIFFIVYPSLDRAMRPQQTNRILQIVDEKTLVVPKRLLEHPTTVNINGTNCKATEFADAYLDHNGSTFRLEYNRDIFIDDNRDPCLEGDVPTIDIKFDLTFEQSSDSKKISFVGQVVPDCKACRPRKAQAISGVLTRLGEDRFQLSFHGDLSASVELETLK